MYLGRGGGAALGVPEGAISARGRGPGGLPGYQECLCWRQGASRKSKMAKWVHNGSKIVRGRPEFAWG